MSSGAPPNNFELRSIDPKPILEAPQDEMDNVSVKSSTEQNYGSNGLRANDAERTNENGPDKGPDEPDERTSLLDSPDADNADKVIIKNEDDIPFAYGVSRNRKLMSNGMLDVALLSANANNLRYILVSREGDIFSFKDLSDINRICIILLLISIFLQILVGIGLLLSARYNMTNYKQRIVANRLGNSVLVGIYFITAINIFIPSFCGPVPGSPGTNITNNTNTTDACQSSN